MKQAALFFTILCFLSMPLSALAADAPGFHAVLSESEGREGNAVELTLSYDGGLGEIGAFLVRVDFDPDIFEYQRVRTSSAVRDAYTLTLPHEDWIDSGYVRKAGDAEASPLGDAFAYRFKIRPQAKAEEASFRVTVYQVVDPDSAPLSSREETLPYTILPPLSSEASLLSLSPSEGKLEPSFSPDCFDYVMTVPFEVTTVTFLSEPAEGAVCKVNRKNLGAGGSDTGFLLTVTAEDGESKSVYRVTVHREEKKSAPTLTPTPKPASTPKPATPKPGAAETVSSTPKQEDSRQESPASTKSPSPPPKASPSASPKQQEASPEPRPPAAVSEIPTPPGNGGMAENEAPLSTTFREKSDNLTPALLVFLAFNVMAYLSAPISKWLSWLFAGKKKENKTESITGNGEEHSPDKEDPPE